MILLSRTTEFQFHSRRVISPTQSKPNSYDLTSSRLFSNSNNLNKSLGKHRERSHQHKSHVHRHRSIQTIVHPALMNVDRLELFQKSHSKMIHWQIGIGSLLRLPLSVCLLDVSSFRRRARSTTPTRGPFHLNPDRERLLMSLADSEGDIAQITKQLSSVKDVLTKLKLVRIRCVRNSLSAKEK